MQTEGQTSPEQEQESYFSYGVKAATAFLTACFAAVDYIGETAADFLGITSSRYQYVLDAYERHMSEIEEEERMIQIGIERQHQRDGESRRGEISRDEREHIDLEKVSPVPGSGTDNNEMIQVEIDRS